MIRFSFVLCKSLSMLLLALVLPAAAANATVDQDIYSFFESVQQGEQPMGLPQPLRATATLELFYGNRNHAPAWGDIDLIQAVLKELAASEQEGLTPDDYHFGALEKLKAEYFASRDKEDKDRFRAAFDVLLSDGVLLYARHLQEGKVDPSRIEVTWNFDRRDFQAERVATALDNAIDNGEVVQILESFKPKIAFYGLLKDELARYRALHASYPFQQVPDDTVLKPGMSHPGVAALRQQLGRLGIDTGDGQEPELFDDGLKAAVETFQALHSLDADGIVGRASFAELNTSYADRVEQIRLNLDRVRWVQDELADELVVVNIAGYELYFFRDTALAWQTNVMVGTINTQTPIFRADMSYLVLNPTWTVPRSIIRKSLFRKMAADPNYVHEHNYKLYDNDGNEADPASMDWASYSANRFPYRVVQQPGPGNALGRVKFIFPNQYAIYLHDTPSRALFSRTTRAFSHGCVRVQDPLQFAELLLQDEPGWNRERIDQTLEEPVQKVVRFKQSVDIMLMYWTASPNPDGGIQFHPDIYNRDPKTLALLQEKPRWAPL